MELLSFGRLCRYLHIVATDAYPAFAAQDESARLGQGSAMHGPCGREVLSHRSSSFDRPKNALRG
jgi:hypothetical protein